MIRRLAGREGYLCLPVNTNGDGVEELVVLTWLITKRSQVQILPPQPPFDGSSAGVWAQTSGSQCQGRMILPSVAAVHLHSARMGSATRKDAGRCTRLWSRASGRKCGDAGVTVGVQDHLCDVRGKPRRVVKHGENVRSYCRHQARLTEGLLPTAEGPRHSQWRGRWAKTPKIDCRHTSPLPKPTPWAISRIGTADMVNRAWKAGIKVMKPFQ